MEEQLFTKNVIHLGINGIAHLHKLTLHLRVRMANKLASSSHSWLGPTKSSNWLGLGLDEGYQIGLKKLSCLDSMPVAFNMRWKKSSLYFLVELLLGSTWAQKNRTSIFSSWAGSTRLIDTLTYEVDLFLLSLAYKAKPNDWRSRRPQR